MDIPASWTRAGGRILHESWMPTEFRDDAAALIAELETASPPGLAEKRDAFAGSGQIDTGSQAFRALPRHERETRASEQLLDQRAELLVAVQLLRAKMLVRMRSDTPDFECRWNDLDFGVEVGTRSRREAAAALHKVLEHEFWDGPEVHVTLRRSGERLFSLSPQAITRNAQQLTNEIKNRMAAYPDQPWTATLDVPELKLSAVVESGIGLGTPGARVAYESVGDEQLSNYNWGMAARMIKDTVEGKGQKNSLRNSPPSILVLDISRLDAAGRMPTSARRVSDVFTGSAGEPWTNEFQAELDRCDLGRLTGVLLVRSQLTSQHFETLCWRGDTTDVAQALATALTDQHAPKSGGQAD